MYLEDITSQPMDVSHSCIFDWPDRPPGSIPPEYIPPGGPPGCHPYCQPPPPPIIPPGNPPPIHPPGTYPPGNFTLPPNGTYNRSFGGTHTIENFDEAPPGYTQVADDPPTPSQDNVNYLGASISKTSTRLATHDLSPDGFLWTEEKSAFKEFTKAKFNLSDFNPSTQTVKLRGTQSRSRADGTNEVTIVDTPLVAGGVMFFEVMLPAAGLIHEWDDSVHYQRADQSCSIYYEQFIVENIPYN